MIDAIRREAERRGITRLCHFTPSRNLVHIVGGPTGILATGHLNADERIVYTPTDLQRLDGYPDYISCSIEYPNSWYLDTARSQDVLFKDWVVLLIHPRFLWMPGTLFCEHNAAGNRGRDVRGGQAAFSALFADSVVGSKSRTFTRSAKHLVCWPTDDQAEVLVPDRIDPSDILGIVVSNETQAKNEAVRFSYLGVLPDRFPIIICPTFYNKRHLSNALRSGRRPTEAVWTGAA